MKRDLTPDALRGFALLGILVVNIPFMALNSENGAIGEWAQGRLNGTATFLMASLFAGKFYLLFSFLFGYSSSYIIKNDRANRSRWMRRCLALMLFGAIHFSLLWHGDIIFLYGLLGLLLLPFLFRTDRTLKIWTIAIYSFFTFLLTALAVLSYIGERYFPQENPPEITLGELDEVMKSGTFAQAIGPRIELWSLGLISGIFLQGGLAFAAFLLGVRLARSNFLSTNFNEGQNAKLIKIGLLVGLPIQFFAAFILVRNEQSAEPSNAAYLGSLFLAFTAAPLLSMAYVGLIKKLAATRPKAVSWMAPAGRISLTIYISQSVITSLIFGPWGLGLFQRLETWSVLLLALLIWLVLVFISHLLLRRFRQGPLEYLMHKMTTRRARSEDLT